MKLSTVTYEDASAGRSTPRAFLEQLVGEFGADRIAWGSNFPASEGPLAGLVALAREWVAFLPADDQLLSYSYDGIGQSLLGLGKLQEARAALERALAIRGTDPVDLADTQFALARTLWQSSGQQKVAAIRYGEQARRDYQRAAKQDRVAGVDAWLAKHR